MEYNNFKRDVTSKKWRSIVRIEQLMSNFYADEKKIVGITLGLE